MILELVAVIHDLIIWIHHLVGNVAHVYMSMSSLNKS
jgi:hypothetical protein